MENTEGKRKRRTPEEMVESIDAQIEKLTAAMQGIEDKKQNVISECDAKIADVKAKIDKLTKKKDVIQNPKPRKPRMTEKQRIEALVKKARKSGLKYADIEKALNLDNDEPAEEQGSGEEA